MGLAKVKPASAASSLVDIEAVEAQVAKQQAEAQELARQTEEQSKVIQQAFVGLPPPTSGNLSQGDRIRLLTAVVRDLIKLTADGTGGLEEPLRGLLDRLAVLD